MTATRLIRAYPRPEAGGTSYDGDGTGFFPVPTSVQEGLDSLATARLDDRWKQPVRVATTGDITIATALNSGDTIDGVTLADGDRVLVKSQSDASENGIYVVSSSPARASDYDGSTEVLGSVVQVIAGTANAGKRYYLDITSIPIIGTDDLTFTEITGGGSTDVWWLNVEDFGAVHDGSTDDTAAIQAGIDAVRDNALAGTGQTALYFPQGVYIVNGALQDTGRSNAQLLLPRINSTSSDQIAIYLFGEAPARPIVSVGATTLATPENGVIIESTLGSGSGALLGAWGPSGSWQDGSAVQVKIENIAFRMPANPTNDCLDFSHVMGVELINVLVDTGEYNLPSVTQPTNANTYGIRTPLNVVSSGFAWLRTVNVVGYWCGFDVSELANLDMCHAWACIYGFSFNEANHGIYAKRIGAFGVQRGITSPGDPSTVYVAIEDFQTEHETNPPNPSWILTVYDIDDPNDAMLGYVRYHNQTYGAAPGGMPLINGGAGLSIEVGFESWQRIVGVVEQPNAAEPTTPDDGGTWYVESSKPMFKDDAGDTFDLSLGGGAAGGDLSGTYPNPSVVDDSHNHTSATAPGGGFLLISDTPSTPLVFADIIQNEAQDDLVYSD